MAHIDNLIDAIKDPQLRVALRAEYDKVAKNRRLGLVFDRHLPESVVLPGYPVRDGEKVQVLVEGTDDPTRLDGSGVWTVTGAGPETTTLRDGDGESREVLTDRLVATREFGDPMYPGLTSTGRVVRGGGDDGGDGGKPFHTVINAENYHALEALLFAHEGQVDAIYIDPPYNTGARDWKYNNDYVDDVDPYRHSKWLSFIERRLVLAKRLLKPQDSVLIVTIDEKEYLRLGLLLEQIFPEARQQMISSVINPAGAGRSAEFSRTDEYVYFVRLGGSAVQPEQRDEKLRPVTWDTLRRSDLSSVRPTRPGQFYPFFVDVDTSRILGIGEPLAPDTPRASVQAPSGCVTVFPVRPDGTEMNWGITAEPARQRLADGYIRVGKHTPSAPQLFAISYLTGGIIDDINNGRVKISGRAQDGSVIAHYSDGRLVMPTTAWSRPSHDAQRYGTNILKSLIPDRRFPFPKSLYAVEDALRLFLMPKPEALVLDFFAGSGTTTHAVMRLNRQDGGRRRSVCVTNNEVGVAEQSALRARGLKPGDDAWEAQGVCRFITEPRLVSATTGTTSTGAPVEGDYRFVDEFPMSEGFEENVEFFTLTYEDPVLVSLGRRFEAVAPLLWLRAGAVGERIDHIADEGWALPLGAVYGVLFDTTAWGAFVAAVARRDDIKHAFVVTDSLVEYQQVVARLSPTLRTTRLYADYLRSFEINARL